MARYGFARAAMFAGVSAAAGPALGATVQSTVGPIDLSCAHEVPNGSTFDANTGNVTLNGAVVATHAPCTGPNAPDLSRRLPGPATSTPSTSTTQGAGQSQWYAVPVQGVG